MVTHLRNSLAAKLLVAGLLLAILVVGSVSSYLLVSRDRQTRAGALSNADNRAVVIRQVLDRFTAVQSASAAVGLAEQTALAEAVSRSDAGAAARALFAAGPNVDLSGEVLVITNAAGAIVYSRAAVDLPAPPAGSELTPASVVAARTANGIPGCDINLPRGGRPAGDCGLELLGGRQPSYDVAVPILSGGRTVGTVAYLAPLGAQLQRFKTLFEFPTAFISTERTDVEVRSTPGGDAAGTTPDGLRAGLARGDDIVHDTYRAPTARGGLDEVAGSFVAVRGLDHRHVVGYIGVEAPLSIFVGDTRTDELTVVAITLLVLFLTAIAIAVFVNRFVKQPIAILERGVARIAGGDYGTPIELHSRDELGRLAVDVNRMRSSIAEYLGEIRRGRKQLDNAVSRMSTVSRTLTMTTGGVGTLETEVVRTARAIAGPRTTAVLAVREGDGLTIRAADPPQDTAGGASWPVVHEVLAGRASRGPAPGGGLLTAVPMFYQDDVIGALAIVVQPDEPPLGAEEEAVLTVLANNAAVAMENTRLFEQGRETVRRLRELDAMKTDFLSTVQHELRTPLTAILGLADLMELCWETWADEPKLEAVRDIQLAARNLHEMVETIINFALLEEDSMRLDLAAVAVRPAIEAARSAIAARMKGGIPLAIDISGGEHAAILADAIRFEEVMRALLDNAIKFSPDGEPVSVVIAVEDQNVRIDVVDHGIGIPSDQLSRVFDRFFQVDSTATRRSGGTGMGLALVRRLAEAHGARITVESAVGKGSRFSLLWPGTASAAGG
ncbi:MAG: ATP-binding protein [Candidatus Dormibacteria bacterium]